MKKCILKKSIILLIIIFLIFILEWFGLKFLRNYEIIFCNKQISVSIKEEMSNITNALPSQSTYSIKLITKNNEKINIYYMYDGEIVKYNLDQKDIHNININKYISQNAIKGETIYIGVIITTLIILLVFSVYIIISKNTLKYLLKMFYMILSISVIFILLCIIPMISKNHGENIYYYSIIIGLYIIGLIYGYKNKVFFLPAIIMVPIYLLADWFNYSNGILRINNICSYIFINFIGGLTARIIQKSKKEKIKYLILYGIIFILLILGALVQKIETRVATMLISSCCKASILGVVFSLITYIINIIIYKIKDMKIAKKKILQTRLNLKIKIIVETIIIIILIIASTIYIIYSLYPKDYISSNLSNTSKSLKEQYAYKIIKNKVYITTNAGKNWTEVPEEFNNLYQTSKDFSDKCYFLSKDKIIFEINDEIIKLIYSDDNGNTWNASTIQDVKGYIVYIKFFNKLDGIAVICYGNELGQREYIVVSRTNDGGENWVTRSRRT